VRLVAAANEVLADPAGEAPADPAHRALAERFRSIRGLTRALIEPLGAEDCAVQSMDDASPAKWHLAHTSWYFETFVLEPGLRGYRAFHPAFRVLFNSYYQGVGAMHPRPQRGLLTRPALDDVLQYRAHVERGALEWLASGPRPELLPVFELGLHHEQQHQELLLMDIQHAFWCNPLRPAYRPYAAGAGAPAEPLAWHASSGGLGELGHAGGVFGFDNEFPRHRVYLQPFELASRPVSCSEYLAFVEDGGYERPELWLSDGWAARQRGAWQAPLYWERDEGSWLEFGLGGMAPLRLGAPVSRLSYFEADAYARWAGARLPSEAEWESFAAAQPVSGNFLDSDLLRPEASRTSGGSAPLQLYGDVWEWTHSPYAPYPGYRPPQGVIGEYNGKFMCSQYSLRGGACITPAQHLRATYRNFFYPAQRWMCSGLRLARDLA
jgi:ergothioneine biosynthesis protein EgtB